MQEMEISKQPYNKDSDPVYWEDRAKDFEKGHYHQGVIACWINVFHLTQSPMKRRLAREKVAKFRKKLERSKRL